MDLFLGILLFFVILYYGLKLFLRYGLPWLITRFMKNQQSKFNQFGQQQQPQQKKEGEVEIKGSKKKKQKDDDDFGEYVDFEDINE